MFRRYGSWPDAVAACNWGPAQIDRWISGGRSFDKLPLAVMRYQTCVLAESALQPAGIGDSALAGIGTLHLGPGAMRGERHWPGGEDLNLWPLTPESNARQRCLLRADVGRLNLLIGGIKNALTGGPIVGNAFAISSLG
jgi:hypothetical protein